MCCVHNIILGKLWIEQYGTVEIVNHRYSDKYFILRFKLFRAVIIDWHSNFGINSSARETSAC